MERTPQKPLVGIFWMLMTGLLFVAVTASVKLVGPEVPAAQSAFLRYILGLVFLIPMIRPILQANLTFRQVKLFGMRGAAHAIAIIFWFYAMARIPIADVSALNYLNPIYVTVGAALFLKEPLPPRRLVAVCVALVGALIILRPGMREIESGHLAMLVTAVLFAVSYLMTKILSGEASAAVVVGMLSIVVPIVLLPFAWAVWVPVSWENLGWLFLVACFATAGHYTMTLALAAAPVTVTQPVTFLQLVWAVLLGVLVFDEAVDVWVIVGAAVIMASVSFITWREAVAKRSVTPPTHATKS